MPVPPQHSITSAIGGGNPIFNGPTKITVTGTALYPSSGFHKEQASELDSSFLSAIIKKLQENFSPTDRCNFPQRKFLPPPTYIRPLGKCASSEKVIDVLDRIKDFLASPKECSLLVLAESGLGKSLLGRYIVWTELGKFEQELLTKYYFPLFIHLPPNYKSTNVSELLDNYLKKAKFNDQEIKYLRNEALLLVVLDGYDEIEQDYNQSSNIVRQNNWWGVKYIITSRLDALLEANENLFWPENHGEHTGEQQFVKIHLSSFTAKEIKGFLIKYADKVLFNKEPTLIKDLRKYLNLFPGIQKLATIPCVLTSIVETLCKYGEISALSALQQSFVCEKIYEKIIDNWFKAQRERLQKQNSIKHLRGDIKEYLMTYSENLACYIFQEGCVETALDENVTLNERFFKKNEIPLGNRSASTEKLTLSEMCKIRSGSLLKVKHKSFKFLNKRIIEYFSDKQLFQCIVVTALYIQKEFSTKKLFLNEHLLTKERNIIDYLARMASNDKDFIELLWYVLHLSKNNVNVSIAAANAITILNYARVDFSEEDLRHIKVPGADLTRGLFHHTDLSNSDLSEVIFTQAYCDNANFNNANVQGSYFGPESLGSAFDDSATEQQLIAAHLTQTFVKEAWLNKISKTVVFSTDNTASFHLNISTKFFRSKHELGNYISCFDNTADYYAHISDSSKSIEIWNVSGAPVHVKTLDVGEFDGITAIALSTLTEGKKIAFSERKEKTKSIMRIFDVSTSSLIEKFELSFFTALCEEVYISHLIFSHDETFLIAACSNGYVFIGNILMKTGSWLYETLEHVLQPAVDLYMSEDNQNLLITRNNGVIENWDFTEQKILMKISTQPGVSFTRLSTDKKTLINIQKSGQIYWQKSSRSTEYFVLASELLPNMAFCARGAKFSETKGLSNEAMSILEQLDVNSSPSNKWCAYSSKEFLLARRGEPSDSASTWSVIKRGLPLNYQNWVISIMDVFASDGSTQMLLIVEGMNQFSRGLIFSFEYNYDKQLRNATIVEKAFRITSLSDREEILTDLSISSPIKTISWGIPRQQAIKLIKDVQRDQQVTQLEHHSQCDVSSSIKCDTSISSASFAWIKSKLRNQQIQLPNRWRDCVATVPKIVSRIKKV